MRLCTENFRAGGIAAKIQGFPEGRPGWGWVSRNDFSDSPGFVSGILGAVVADRAIRHGAMLSDKKPALPHALGTPALYNAPLRPKASPANGCSQWAIQTESLRSRWRSYRDGATKIIKEGRWAASTDIYVGHSVLALSGMPPPRREPSRSRRFLAQGQSYWRGDFPLGVIVKTPSGA